MEMKQPISDAVKTDGPENLLRMAEKTFQGWQPGTENKHLACLREYYFVHQYLPAGFRKAGGKSGLTHLGILPGK